ncbi:MAG: hypothetical protein ACRCSB_05705 [Bacteroidales bacterium]
MKKSALFIVLFSSILSFTACKKQAVTQEAKPVPAPIPVALTENKIKSYSYSRGGEDLVEELYEELMKTSPDLQQIEEDLENITKEKVENEAITSSFFGKATNYYRAANQHINQIKDSTLKKKMLGMIEAREANFKKQTQELTQLLQKMDTNEYSLSDYHAVLKITKTLPLIESYQKSNLPDAKGIKKVILKQEELMKKMGK